MSSFVSPTVRARVRAGVEPIARLLGRVGLTPNALTLIGFGIAIAGAWLAASQAWLVAGVVVAFGAVFDLFDGALARATGTTSRFGAFMDSTFDRAGEAVVYVGIGVACLVAGFELGVLFAMTAMATAFMVSYVRAKSESLGFTPGSGMANVGLAPREVRTALLVVGLVLTGMTSGIGGLSSWLGAPVDWGRTWLIASLGLITVLATLTTIQRIHHVYQQSKKEQQ